MNNQSEGKLLIIVPVTKMAGKLENFRTWVSSIPIQSVKVLVVHDYADNATSKELKKIIAFHAAKNIELIEEKVQSPGAARNVGLREENFEWISFVDSDDLVDVSILLKMIEVAPSDTEIIIGDYVINSLNGSKNIKTSECIDPKMSIALDPGFWRMIFRRDIIGSVRFTSYKMGEDQLFLLALDFFNRKLFFSSFSPYTYFKNIQGQLTSSFDNLKDITNVIKHTIALYNKSDYSIQKYVGMMVLKQIITEFKTYSLKNFFKAIFKVVSSISQIKLKLLPRLFKNLVLILFRRINKKSKTTFVVLTGGLGNQLFQYAAALSRNASKIIIDGNLGKPRLNDQEFPALTDFELVTKSSLSPDVRHHKFFLKCSNYVIRSGMNPVGIEKTKAFNFLIKICFSIIFSILLKTRLTLIQAKDNGYFEMGEVMKNDLLIGYFQSYKWANENEVKSQLCNLKLKKQSEILINFLTQHSGKSILSIHVRLGDYKSQYDFGVIDRSYYQNAINFAKSKIAFDCIWLFSDEPSVALDLLPNEIIDQIIVVPNFNGSAAETLEAMRYCKSYIIANSSLSWWGAFLNYGSEAPLVIAPKPWFKNSKEPSLIINPSWIRLPAWPNLDN